MDLKLKEKFINTANFNLLVIEIPEEEINDKLTYLSREKGLVRKSFFDDFLILMCVANMNDFMAHLSQKGGEPPGKLNEIRMEIIEKVIEVNPLLRPENLFVNKNNVVKMKKDDSVGITLVENEVWTEDIYKDTIDAIAQAADKTLDKSKVKHMRDLGYESIQKFWRRIQQYVVVKKFDPESAPVVFANRTFSTRISFEQYIVTICVEEIEDLFMLLDKMGLPQNVPPPILIHELYNLCISTNPFLNYKFYKNTIVEEEEDDDDEVVEDPNEDPFTAFNQRAGIGDTVDPFARRKKKKLFRHVAKDTLLSLAADVKTKVVGQDKAVEDLAEAIQRASVGLKDPEHPIGSFVFAGYSGIGKTYTAKILAEKLIGSEKNLITIDCSEYSADHEYAKLIGAPAGYIGHEQGGYLTNAITKKPFSVVLFDEIEKASEKIHQLMLQIMDEARLTDGRGKKVSFKDAVIIMTSNLGVKELREISKSIGFGNVSTLTTDKRNKAFNDALKKKFKPEFLNRVTSIINFGALNKDNYIEIIKLELERLKANLKDNKTDYSDVKLVFDPSLYNHLYQDGIDDRFGARPLKRIIEREISSPLAKKLLVEEDIDNIRANICVEDGEIVIDFEYDIGISEPPFYFEAPQEENTNVMGASGGK